jgi:hypothetical protein
MDFSVKYDIVVTGAGIAGIAAALAAARRGHKVALIEKQTLIGGLATSGLIYVYLPLCDGEGTQVTSGIAEELLLCGLEFSPFKLSKTWGGCGSARRSGRDRYEVEFAPAALTLAMDELLAQAGVDLWLDTRVCDVRQRSGRVIAVEVENTSGRGLLRGRCFVDASGEAILIRRASGEFSTDVNSLSLWLMEMSPKADAMYPFTDSLHIQSLKFPSEVYQPASGLDGKDVTNYTRFCWQEMRKFYRDSYAEGNTPFNHYPVHLPAMPQFRKMAAAKCLAMLKTGDEYHRFEDSIGMTGDWRKSGPVWETPLRCLIPEKVDGVLMAGRCIGAIEDAWEVYRVIPTAAMTGEAAGISAALCVEQRKTPHGLPSSAVQDSLRKQKIKLHLDEVGLSEKYIK